MNPKTPFLLKRLFTVSFLLLLLLLGAMFLGLSLGSSENGVKAVWQSLSGARDADSMLSAIIWRIRFPRVVLAALVGATLSLGGLVFQALLRNPLAEAYILGISGGSAVGAIIGILMGLSRFPGVSFTAFAGSMSTLLLIFLISSGQTILKKDSLLLSGVMINAFCSSIIMFLVSMTYDSRLHNIMFWLMGDLSTADISQVGILAASILPCFVLIFCLSNSMNLLLLGKEMAQTMGVNIKFVTVTLLVATSFMVSATVCHCGLIGFVGLVIPHLLRLLFGPDHRVLVPACMLGGGAYMVFCDLLARVLPEQGEMPAGVITAMIGAPLFIFLLKRSDLRK
ncbi:MAG: iron ABC transporter permease [Proteobacteria bacterium]|nr:iron ABC transporter permease [Desulfobacteraceae bacterium]MBU3980812.1 iron ABC transporter permease [Pseudomonadota bacterium]MBU4014449.1 iron ABC transporter permease [Pseudomonadota bacterium]MBU4067400.1 iron ABC transporter permease [Pseudomonadota bacterium]MBU4100800.1 iron ABC transporter permease [Pseudomonadota bacterium]